MTSTFNKNKNNNIYYDPHARGTRRGNQAHTTEINDSSWQPEPTYTAKMYNGKENEPDEHN